MGRWGFWRRPQGRHALGAAVTELPSAPVRVAPAPVLVLDPTPPPGEQTADEVVPEELAPVAPAPAEAAFALDPLDAAVPLASLPVAPEYAYLLVPEQPVARVSLGFRDGTTTSLAADSVQAMALEELASLLTQRD